MIDMLQGRFCGTEGSGCDTGASSGCFEGAGTGGGAGGSSGSNGKGGQSGQSMIDILQLLAVRAALRCVGGINAASTP